MSQNMIKDNFWKKCPRATTFGTDNSTATLSDFCKYDLHSLFFYKFL